MKRMTKKIMIISLMLLIAVSAGVILKTPVIDSFSTAINKTINLSKSYAAEENSVIMESELNNLDASVVVYDASTFDSFKNRTKEEVADKYSKAYYSGKTYINGNSSTYYSVPASTKAPYYKGVLSDDTQTIMSEMTNYLRWLSGANPMIVPSSNSSQYAPSLQAQALDRVFEFNHYISNDSKPADMDDATWNEGFACTHNILAWNYTPAGAITGWLDEGYSLSNNSWGTVGHRNAILSPTYSEIQYGYCGSIGVGKDISSNNTYKEIFSAYPAPGYMPNEFFTPSRSAWTVYYDYSRLRITSASNIAVKVTNLTSGVSYTCTSADNTASVGTRQIDFVQPSDYSGGKYTDKYQVEITGFTDVASGNDAKIVYTVDFFDVRAVMSAPVKTANSITGTVYIDEDLINKAGLQMVAKMLPDEINVTNDMYQSAKITANSEWKVDMENGCFYTSANASDLPSNMNDAWSKLDRIELKYVSSANGTTVGKLNFSSAASKPGEDIRITAYHYYSGYSSYITQIYKFDNSSPNGVLRFDSRTSTEFDADASNSSYYYHYYDFKNVGSDDTGLYISMFSTESMSTIYVSKPVDFEVRTTGKVVEAYGDCAKLRLSTEMNSTNHLNRIAKMLPKTGYAVSDIGDTVEIELDGEWTVDEENKCFVNFVNRGKLSKLTTIMTDPNYILDRVTMPYEVSSVCNSSYYFQVNTSKSGAKPGDSVKFTVYRQYDSCNSVAVYKVDNIDEESFNADFVFDNNTEGVDSSSRYASYYTKEDLSKDDEGYYYSVAYNSEADAKTRYYYISREPKYLEIRDFGIVTTVYGYYSSLYISADDNNPEYLSRIAAAIPKKAILVSDYGENTVVETAGEWTYDKENNCFVNYVKSGVELPENFVDRNGKLNDKIVIDLTTSTSLINTSSKVIIRNQLALTGGDINITINPYYYGYNDGVLFCLADDGSFYIYDETSPEYEKTDDSNVYFKLTNVSEANAGEYGAIISNPNSSAISKYGFLLSRRTALEVRDYGNATGTYGPYSTLYLNSTLTDADSLAKIAAGIEKTAYIKLDTGDEVEVPIIGAWEYSSEDYGFIAKIDKTKIPSSVKDPDGILDGKIIMKYQSAYTGYFSSTVNYSKCLENDKVEFSIYNGYSSYNITSIRQINTDENGNYIGFERFNSSSSPEWKAGDSVNSYSFEIENAKYSDSGEYITFFYNSNSSVESRVAYLAGLILKVDVVNEVNLTSVYAPYRYVYIPRDISIDDYYNKVAAMLPKEVEIVTDVKCPIKKLTTDGAWVYNATSKCFENKVTNIPELIKDPNGRLSKITIPVTNYYYNDSYNLWFDKAGDFEKSVDFGEDVVIAADRGVKLSFEIASIYKFEDGDAKYNPILKFRTKDSDEYDDVNSTDYIDRYIIENVDGENSGTYIGLFEYDTVSASSRYAIVSSNEATLTVEHNYEPEYTWSKDGTECELALKCSGNENHAVSGIEMVVSLSSEEKATCSAEGFKEYKASVTYLGVTYSSTKKITTPVDSANHAAANIVIDKAVAATCTETGLTEGKHCKECGTIIVKQEIIAKLPHTEEVVKGYPATCTKDGLTDGKKCSVCGEILEAQEVIEKKPHTEEVVKGYDSTCTKAGLTDGKKCSVCGEILEAQEVIKKLPHTEEVVKGYPATCTKDGLTDGKKCSVCGEILEAQQTIEKKPHTEVTIKGYDATCTEDGLTDGKKCSVCGEILEAQKTISAKGHSYYLAETVEPTYDAEGYVLYRCEHCGDEYTVNTSQLLTPSIVIDNYEVTMPTETSLTLMVTYTTNLQGKAVEWSSSNEEVATVDQDGVVTAHTYGSTIITATLIENGMKATCEVNTLFYDVAGNNIKGDPDYQYFFDPVYWAAEHGITTGYNKVFFGPERTCTRQELLIFLWRIAGQPAPNGDARMFFSDVTAGTNTATNKSIAWAFENGITKGYTEKGKTIFKPTNPVTRQETMIFLWRTAGKPVAVGSLTFKDCSNISKNTDTYKAVLWGSKNGITSGYSDGTFGLTGDCLREAIVTFLYRFNNKNNYIK